MDPAGILLNVAAILSTIDRIQETYNSASRILSSIRSQIELLETGLQQIHEWQYITDPTSKAQVMHSLHAAIETVTRCIQRLQDDLKPAIQAGSSVDTSDSKAKFPLSEPRLTKHLIDTRECVSLIQFTLSTCQLPVGQGAQREIEELGMGAKALARAHTSYGRGRQSVIRWQMPEQDRDRSVDFNTFVSSVLEMERDLPDDSASERPSTRVVSWDMEEKTANNHAQDREELHLPGEGSSPLSAEAHNQAIYQSSPARPPKISRSPSASSSEPFRRHLFRKPLRQTSISAQSVMSNAPSRQFSVSAQSILSDATLDASPTLERGPSTASTFSRLRPHLSNRRATAPSDTNMLFGQATRSLSSLAENFMSVGMQETEESPPPYVHSPASPPVRDVKRRNTQSSLGLVAECPEIIQVVRDNQIEILLTMLENGIGIDEVDPVTKRTAIMEATLLRRTHIAQILIRSGSRLHLKDVDGNTALHFAAVNGDANTCMLLLDAGAQLDEYNRNGETPLDLGARGGHTETVIVLLNTWTLQAGHATSLIKGFLEASKSCNASTAQAFIERGIKPKKIKDSWKPTAYAAQSGSNAMIDLMIAHKCSLKDRSPDGWTALHFAADSGQTAMVEKLLLWKISWKAQTKKLQETALHLAILAGHTSTAIALILHKDANISMKDADDHQAIHHAIRNGDVQLAALLLNKGAKLDAQTKYGWTPMHIAAAYGHLPLVAELITRGANIEERLESPSFKTNKKTNEAARKGYWCEIRWPHAGARPLHLALEFGQDEAANILIASGAKIDEADSKDWRPLHYAAWNCRPQMVEVLLTRGTSSHSTTADGNTPLSLGFREPGLMASYEDKEQIVGILNAAMYAHKKSKLTKLTGFMTMGNKSRDAIERNKAWHMAELAAALYQSGQLGEGDTESDVQLTPTISSQYNGYGNDQDEGSYDTQPSSSRLTKTMAD